MEKAGMDFFSLCHGLAGELLLVGDARASAPVTIHWIVVDISRAIVLGCMADCMAGLCFSARTSPALQSTQSPLLHGLRVVFMGAKRILVVAIY